MGVVTGMPEIGMPEIGMPETGMPEIGMPETGMPETGMPETGMPEIVGSGAGGGRPATGPAAEKGSLPGWGLLNMPGLKVAGTVLPTVGAAPIAAGWRGACGAATAPVCGCGGAESPPVVTGAAGAAIAAAAAV